MKINDLIKLPDKIIQDAKLHFAIGASDRFMPLYAFYKGDFKTWQENQSQNNFKSTYILALIYYAKNEWLFAGIFRQKGVKQIEGRFFYDTEELDIANELKGRLVVWYDKPFRQSYPYLNKYIHELELLEIFRERYTVEPFPGFANVKISFGLLQSIINQEEQSWKVALSNTKGIYLITDRTNGKHYVGSAYGNYALWSRWQEYAMTYHGGNKELKRLIRHNGKTYADNFLFTIIETRSINAEDDEIIQREQFWKDVLLSREFGYNKN